MATNDKSWGELDLKSIADRLAGGLPASVTDAARKFAAACLKSGVNVAQATAAVERAFADVSESSESTELTPPQR